MNRTPKVGIVIPNYERIEYLKESVESAVNQTYENLEIVIVDDDSPDIAVKEYLEKITNPKIKWCINKTSLGTAKNYDTGVRLLSEDVEWCVILDNDDFLDKDFIKGALEAYFKYPQSKVIHCCQILVAADKKIISRDGEFPESEKAEDYLLLRCMGRREIRSSCLFFNLQQFKKIGGYPLFPSGMCTDSVFIFALAFDNIVTFSKDAVVYIRIHDNAESITADNIIEKLISVKQMQNYCMDVYKNNKIGNLCSNKKKIIKYLKHYSMLLTSALLIRKYREILSTQEIGSAKKSLGNILRLCRENDLTVPLKFFILTSFFKYTGIGLEQIFFARFINELNKPNIIIGYIRKCLRRVPFYLFLREQLSIVLDASKRQFIIIGFRYCDSCGCYSLFYWWKYYEDLLRKIMPEWGVNTDYIEQMIKRENVFCGHCGSVFRMRAHAKTIFKIFNQSKLSGFVSFLKNNPSFFVYETANYRLFSRKKLKKINNYVVSEFHPEYPFGQKVKGIRNENLERLTFDNQSIDLLITGEVLEHVSDLSKALSEICRVLKTGGHHIFTIPVNYSLDKTRLRALVGADSKITYLLPQVVHGDDITKGILVYRDFGRDVNKIVESFGFDCTEDKYYLNGKPALSVYITRKIIK